MKTKILINLGLGFLLLVPGCVTVDPQDFNNLQAQVARESGRQRELARRVEMLGQNVEGTRVPQADMRAEMDSLHQALAQLNGRLEELNQQTSSGPDTAELEYKVRELEARAARMESYLGINTGASLPAGQAKIPGGISPAAPPAQPSDPYTAGVRLYEQKSYSAARDQLRTFLEKSPQSGQADNAQFLIGESLYAEKQYDEAILAYNQLIKRYPNSSKSPAAMLKQGMSFNELRDQRTAKIVFNQLIKAYPNSPEAKQAATLVKGLP